MNENKDPKVEEKSVKPPASKTSNSRKKKLKKLVLQYFHRLTQGCGNPECKNPNCISSGAKKLSKQEALKRAMVLASKKNRPEICKLVNKKQDSKKIEEVKDSDEKSKVAKGKDQAKATNGSKKEVVPVKAIEPITIKVFKDFITEAETAAKKTNNPRPDYKKAIRMIGSVFGDDTALSRSFPLSEEVKATEEQSDLDLKAVNEFYTLCEDAEPVQKVLDNTISRLSLKLTYARDTEKTPVFQLRKYLILMENPTFLDPEYHNTFKKLCEAISRLHPSRQKILVKWLSKYPAQQMEDLVSRIQQYITVRWYTTRQVDDLQYGTIVLGLLYRANEPWLGHDLHIYDEEKSHRFFLRRDRDRKRSDKADEKKTVKSSGETKAASDIVIEGVGTRHDPLVEPEMFNNDAVNAELNLKADYKRWIENQKFSFCKYPFILDASSKSDVLRVDARYQMSSHFREAFLTRLYVGGEAPSPYLRLPVRRNNLVRDAIVELQNARLESMRDDDDDNNNMFFKKPLKVKFTGEEGVDEGGVKKEFFQLVTSQLFDHKYGMFVYNKDTRVCWFDKSSLSSDEEFELVGILLGLAIYNSVILDLRFPMYVYKKLMGYDTTFKDLEEVDPEMAKGLKGLLKFKGDVENTYCRTFSVQEEAFGAKKTVELKKGGSKIPLTEKNRTEYVQAYTKYLLEDSISRQFAAFKRGFMKVCGGPALKLFRPEELQMMICGSENLDFEALEKKTQYDGGYDKDSPVIKNLWKILKNFNIEQKKKFLMFCTGSDRAPINGLGDLSFTISKNGSDSERLPTSHTCFNHLLLPQYSTAEKLERNLLIAIQNCKGFGLL
mmetsp:Transcript_17880/g.26766  ORF Transcript_17880/g.26766 Transcript_17880/m.26766 type:complete len:834 (+) Transcript_17880:80-2581(+)